MDPEIVNDDMPGLGGRTLLFLHIPKAAGTSFRDLLGRRFTPDSTIRVGLKDSSIFQTLANADHYRFVHGHFPYEVVNLFAKRPFLFTVLREPVNRAISAYEFMKRQNSYMQGQAAAGRLSKVRARDYAKAAQSATLSEFVSNEPQAAARHLGNLQVELLTCTDLEKRHAYDESYEITVSEAELELAKERLAKFDAFGLVERLPESTEALAYALQTRPFGELGWCNKTRTRAAVEEIDRDTMGALLELTVYDRQLHAFATDLFERRRSAMLRELRNAGAALSRPRASAPRQPLPSSFTPGEQIPGDGWYAAESDGNRWFHWSGPASESWIELGSPAGKNLELQIGVLHSMTPESLFNLELLVNDVPVMPRVSGDSLGHTMTATVPAHALRDGGGANRITVRVPQLSRPCDSDLLNDDSRMLGIAVYRMALVAVS